MSPINVLLIIRASVQVFSFLFLATKMICLGLLYLSFIALQSVVQAGEEEKLEECLLTTVTKFSVISEKSWNEKLKGVTDNWITKDNKVKKCRGTNEFPDSFGYCSSSTSLKEVSYLYSWAFRLGGRARGGQCFTSPQQLIELSVLD